MTDFTHFGSYWIFINFEPLESCPIPLPAIHLYPGAKVGYVTVASVLLDLKRIDDLDQYRPIDPREFRKTEEASTLDAAMPGCNVVTRTHTSAVESFREAFYENFLDVVIDNQDGCSLLDTYEYLLAQRTSGSTACPYKERAACDRSFPVPSGATSCPCANALPIYSTDALRVHERFHDSSTNGEAFGEVMQVWERVLLIHLLRWFERQNLLEKIAKIVFIIDGPLAMFGHPAWLSPLIKKELKRLNAVVRDKTGTDILIVGIEKTGSFVTHFEEIDQTPTGEPFFPPRSYALLTDQYIKERVIFSVSDKPYGQDTYFGRKFFYKSKSGARIVGTIPMLDTAQDDTTTDDISKYPSFSTVCAVLDKLVSSRFPNSVGPIITAHSHAAIPLVLGTKVLEQLARALVKTDFGVEIYLFVAMIAQGFSNGKAVAVLLNGSLLVIAGRTFLKIATKALLEPDDIISFDKLHRFASDRCQILNQDPDLDTYASRQHLVTDILSFAEESLRGWLPGSHFELCIFVDREQPLLFAYFDSNRNTRARSMQYREQNPNWYVEKNYEVLKVLADPSSHPRIIQDTANKKNKYTFVSAQQNKQLKSTMLWCIDVGSPCAIVITSDEKNAFRESDPEVISFIKFVGNLARFDLLERRFLYRIRELRPDLFPPGTTHPN